MTDPDRSAEHPADDPWAVPVDLDGTARPAPQPRLRRGVATLAAGGVAAALLGGASLAWAAFNGNTGDQPERHLPASVGAFVKVDLDPSGSQKIDAVRFFSRFPFGKELRGGGDGDPRQALYEALARDDHQLPPWSEVRDWIGDRAGIGVLPGDQPAPAAVLQVTDEALARATLAEKAPAGAFTVADGWATVSDTKAHLDAVTSGVGKGLLADDATFRRDSDAVGDAGVVAGWADLSRFAQMRDAAGAGVGAGLLAGGGDLAKQRLAMVARFTGGNAELAVRSFGATTAHATGAGPAVAKLPRDTVAAFGLAGGSVTVREQWAKLTRTTGVGDALAQVRRETGLRLPGDLAALLGSRFALAVAAPDASGQPVLGVRAASADAGLGGSLDRLLRLTDSSRLPLQRQDVPGGYVLATSRQEVQALTTDGDLGATAAFRDAVPGADDAQAVVYVDVARLADTYARGATGDDAAALRALRAVGLSSAQTADGAVTTLRVTTR